MNLMMNCVFSGTKPIFIIKRVLCYEGIKAIRREQAYSRVPFSLRPYIPSLNRQCGLYWGFCDTSGCIAG